MEARKTVDIYAAPLPFSNLNVHNVVFEGATIAEMVQSYTQDLQAVEAIVFINDYFIPDSNWHIVRPKSGAIVNIRVIPQGGGGKKNPIASLLSIALLVAAPAISTAILGNTLAATSVLGGLTTYGQILSGAIGLVGKLVISAIAPPPKQSNSATRFVNNAAESPTQFIEGARNSLSPFGVVPVCLGTNRMTPPQAARPFTESQDNKQYVRQLFCWGWGESLQINQLRIGETLISEFNGVEMQHRLDGDLHLGTQIFSNDVFQEDFNVLIQKADGFSTRTTQQDIDEAIVDITFPRGLASFDSQGTRGSKVVELELQYAPTGTSDWSAGSVSYTTYASQNISLNTNKALVFGFGGLEGYTPFAIYLDVFSGIATPQYAAYALSAPTRPIAPTAFTVPANSVLLATGYIFKQYVLSSFQHSVVSFQDNRQSSLYGTTFQDSGDFVPTNPSGTTIAISSGELRQNQLRITGAQTEALRKSIRLRFPSNGQYDIRIQRLNDDTNSDQIFDKAYLTAIKSVTYTQPVVLEGINGTAVRMLASDQLNGSLDQFNAIVSNVILDYDTTEDDWFARPTSNPASIYRYVLQKLPNARALPDAQVDITRLEEWHSHCKSKGYTYNRVIDYEASLFDILQDIASAGAASPTILDGKYSVIIDKEKDDIVQMVTPRNSWGYSAELIYPEQPHAFRVQFRNASKGYLQDERIVYDDGYSAANATKFENLEYMSCTNSNLAFIHGRRHIATGRLRPETHSFNMDVEHLVATRGDRIKFAHDVPIIGVGDGRIKTIADDGSNITGFTIDDIAEFINGRTYYVRIRKTDNTQLYLSIGSALSGNLSSFTFTTPQALNAFDIGDLCYFVEAGGELDLIITKIEPRDDMTALVTCVDYAPAIFTAESAIIPPFTSKITTPLSLVRPLPPLLVEQPQSDETAMTRNADGSFVSRMVITLNNRNDGDIETRVQVRQSGTDLFSQAQIQESSPSRVVITGLQDGVNYDVWISYRRVGTIAQSQPLQINNYKFIGASGTPDDVANFRSVITGDIITLSWDANDDIDISHYQVRFTRVTSGASWETAQTLEAIVNETRLTVPFIGGTYFVKAIDLLGNESENAASIATYGSPIANAIATLDEAPDFVGTKDNVVTRSSNSIVLLDSSSIGYYYFDNEIDLTDVFESQISANLVANGAFNNNVFDMADVFVVSDVFGSGDNDIFTMPDIFDVADVFGIGVGAWSVELQIRTTDDDPSGSPVWSGWESFNSGFKTFRAAQFRVKMISTQSNVTPQITELSVTIDMPDRIERGEDLTVTASGYTVTYSPQFKESPSVVITIQDGATDDRIEYISKTAGGFTIKVWNGTLSAYVTRVFDYVSSGYGRVQ